MAVPSTLGPLSYIRVWHDNSGKGKFRSWFLSYIVVRDIQTNERYEFICNKWFAVEKGDGNLDRLLPVAGRGESTQFSHLFAQKTSKNMKDGHLWFSVFMRPPASRFTRVQRVSCCMSLLYLSMLVNAMWYERVPPKPRSSAVEIGPFALSPEQIGVGFFSNLIVFPITFVIIYFFRKSRLRQLRPSRISEALRKQGVILGARPGSNNNHLNNGKLNSLNVNALSSSTTQLVGRKESTESSATYGSVTDANIGNNGNDIPLGIMDSSGKQKRAPLIKKRKKSKLLPYWCRYIGWFLCVLSMLISIFFLWAYGIQFGDDKTRKWVTSLIVSFFSSILITQPVKVFITAIILSSLMKSPDSESEEDDAEEDEEIIDLSLAPDEEWLHQVTGQSTNTRMRNKRKDKYKPLNLTLLERAKLERLKEIKMTVILKEIASYLFFLWILIVLSYGNRDPNAYLMKEMIQKTFIGGANSGASFSNVKSTEDFYDWISKTFIPELMVGPWYNNYQPYGLRGFMNDRVNRLMGYGVLRQVSTRLS